MFPLIPVLAMLGGAALQYKAQSDASKRATRETMRSLANQDVLQRNAEKTAMDNVQEFSTDNRQAQQSQIETQLGEAFIKPVENAQQINTAQTTTQGDVSNDYQAAKAQSHLNQMKNARTLAGLMAKTTAAGRLRNNEAIRMGDTAADIDRLANFSRGQAGADQIAIQAAARPDAGMQIAGSLLSAAGGYGLAGGFNGVTSAAAAPGELGSGMYLTAVPTGVGSVAPIPQTQGATGLGSGFWGANASSTYRLPQSFQGFAKPIVW